MQTQYMENLIANESSPWALNFELPQYVRACSHGPVDIDLEVEQKDP